MKKINKKSNEAQPRSFRENFDLIRSNLFPILIITLSSLIFSVLYAVNAVNIYKATTLVKISKSQGNILESPLIPNAITDAQSDRFLMNEIEILKSVQLREIVARALIDSFNNATNKRRFYVILNAESRSSKDAIPQVASFPTLVNTQLRTVDIDQKRGLDFVEVSVQSPSPYEAALIANVYAREYRMLNLQFNRDQLTSVKAFLTEQRNEKLSDLNQAEEALRGFQERGGIVALDYQANSLINQLTTLESQRDFKKVELITVEKVLIKYKSELNQKSPQISSYLDKFSSEEYLKSIQAKLAELKVSRELVTLANKGAGSAGGEAVREYDKKIKVLEDLVDQKVKVVKDAIFATTPEELRELTRRIIEEEVKSQSLKTSIDQLNTLIHDYEQKFNLMPKSSIELARLQRMRESLEKLYLLVEEKFQEAVINEQSQPGNVLIVDQARIPIKPSKPNRVLIIIVGFVLGIIIALSYVFLRNYFDNTVKTPEDIQKLNTNVLAWIPQIEGILATGSSDFEFIVARKPDSIPAESFRALRTRVQFSRVDTESVKTILITSSAPSEGKTMICTNLAGSFALSNKKTIIIDCDLRKPRIHSFFKTNRYPGVVDYLFGQVSLEEIIRPSEIPDLFFITAGTIPPNPSEILESQRMKDFINDMKQKYDYVLLDSPPVIAVTDSEILARIADVTALVVSANTTEIELMMRSLEIIQQDNINFIGTILNNFVYKSSYGSYYKYYYYYTRPRKTDRSKLPPQQVNT